VKGHGKAKEGGWPPKDKVGASPLKSLNSNVFYLGKVWCVFPTWEWYKIERNAPKKVGAYILLDGSQKRKFLSITHHPIHRTILTTS
jgi:hypothetical protein